MSHTVFYPVTRKGEIRIAKMDHEDWLLYNDKTHTISTASNKVKPWYLTYRLFRGRGKPPVMLHRVIMMCDKGQYIDHINNDSLDNRKKNLRVATISENNKNVKPRARGTSSYRGVFFNKRNKKWRSRISCNDVNYEVGSFNCEHEAADAYNKKAKELFGNFAHINNITREV